MEKNQNQKVKGKTLTGKVVSVRMKNTVLVEVVHLVTHPIYSKKIRKKRKFAAHNSMVGIEVGDRVIIQETRPISKTKHFQVIKKINTGGKA